MMPSRRKIAVITDVHANLPALDAALAAIREERCDEIVHLGDVIGFGPYPAECVDRLLHTPNMQLVMGNHDWWFAKGFPQERLAVMGEGEAWQHRWVHAQLDPGLRAIFADWPWVIEDAYDDLRVAYLHYGQTEFGQPEGPTGFLGVVQDPSSENLDRIFAPVSADLVFYGHYHPAADTTGRARYVSPGSLGCDRAPVARFAVLQVEGDGTYTVEKHAVPYDWTEILSAT